MKKQFTIFLILFFVLGLVPINFSSATDLATKLKGRILLQVEDVGQAWYIDPETKERAFLGRPADAFKIMRELGLGISEDSYNLFNGYAPSRLSGKILLRVEANGEAYYVFPDDLKMHYLGRPTDAFDVMREKGLGITDEDLNKVPVFQKYKEQVEENVETIAILTEKIKEQDNVISKLLEKAEETPVVPPPIEDDTGEKIFIEKEIFDSTPEYIESEVEPSLIFADIKSTSTITIIVKNKNEIPIPNQLVIFEFVNRLSQRMYSNDDGIAKFIYTSGGTRGITNINVIASSISKVIQVDETDESPEYKDEVAKIKSYKIKLLGEYYTDQPYFPITFLADTIVPADIEIQPFINGRKASWDAGDYFVNRPRYLSKSDIPTERYIVFNFTNHPRYFLNDNKMDISFKVKITDSKGKLQVDELYPETVIIFPERPDDFDENKRQNNCLEYRDYQFTESIKDGLLRDCIENTLD